MKQLLFLLVAILFAGCVTPYQPLGSLGGYSHEQNVDGTIRVEYQGNGWTEPEKVHTYLVRRCAEITLEQGFDFFVIREQSPETNRVMSTTITLHNGPLPKNDPRAHMAKAVLKAQKLAEEQEAKKRAQEKAKKKKESPKSKP
ncbi:MAG: hypothetical protein V1754_04720 [Pseudomonadota bacterium]